MEYIDFCNDASLYSTTTNGQRQVTYTIGDPEISLTQSDLDAMFIVTETASASQITDCVFVHQIAFPISLAGLPITFSGTELKIQSDDINDAHASAVTVEKDQ